MSFIRYCSLIVLTSLILLTSLSRSLIAQSSQPNILWISCEDLSPHFSFYGDSTIPTPNLARLAREGVVYDNVFTSAGVCAPSRCAIITGVNQVTAGGHNMRTLGSQYFKQTGVPSYSIVPPAEIKAFPEFLRAKGYYCSNNVKTDYQFEAPLTVWDDVSKDATWRNRKKDQPFFAVVNFTVTHESQVWARKDHPLHVDPSRIKVPPYYPDTKTVRKDMARFYSNVVDLDSLVGILLQQLEEDGLLENTIIFFWGDHGDGLPFSKRELYDRGLKVPLVIRFPGKKNAGQRDERLISAIDFAPTVLSLASIKPPAYLQGQAFLGSYASKKQNQFIYAARDRMDTEVDRVRALRNKEFKYIRNFHPELPRYQNIQYRLQQDMMKEILALKEEGKLDSIQMKWFEPTKPKEELYDVRKDPYELHDLAKDPAYNKQLLQLRKEMDNWLDRVHDLGAVPEKELLKEMWKGLDHAPVTEEIMLTQKGNTVALSSATEGASIAYKVWQSGTSEPERWEVYTKPFIVTKEQEVKAVAQRIGYEKSKELWRRM